MHGAVPYDIRSVTTYMTRQCVNKHPGLGQASHRPPGRKKGSLAKGPVRLPGEWVHLFGGGSGLNLCCTVQYNRPQTWLAASGLTW